MATTNGKTRCVICTKEKATLKCGGCLKDFCYNHWDPHRQQLNTQLDEIEINRDIFRQSLSQQIEQPNNQILIQEINQWELKSIKIIQQTAEEAREVILKNSNEYHHQLEVKLNELTNQIRESRHENDFNEINLRQFQEELDRLTKELAKPTTISIREDSTSFISKISVHTSGQIVESTLKAHIHYNTKWIQKGVTIVGGYGEGSALNQLNCPIGIYVDEDQTIYVADCGNHRIVEWKYGATDGRVVAGGNGRGSNANQLDYPRDVVVDKKTNTLLICDRDNRRVVQWPLPNGTSGRTIISNIDCNRLTIDNDGYIYVSDYKKHEVKRWKVGETSGIIVAGGNGRGHGLNQLAEPSFVFVDGDHSIYVSDSKNPRVMKWMKDAKEGIIVAGGQGKGNGFKQLSGPAGVFVDHLGTVYVADCDNHRIMRWCKGAREGNIVAGGNGEGDQTNQFNNPGGLSFNQQGNLYVVDFYNNRVQRFDIDQR